MFRIPVNEHVFLALLEVRHAAEMTDLVARNQARLARWQPWAEWPASLASTRDYIRDRLRDFADARQLHLAIRGTRDERCLGACGARLGPVPGTADIGYWLDGGAEGRGYATATVSVLADLLFDGYDVSRLEIRTEPANLRSVALAERLGFTREGVLREVLPFRDRRADLAVYALLRSERRRPTG